jgi:hypothetical protein
MLVELFWMKMNEIVKKGKWEDVWYDIEHMWSVRW